MFENITLFGPLVKIIFVNVILMEKKFRGLTTRKTFNRATIGEKKKNQKRQIRIKKYFDTTYIFKNLILLGEQGKKWKKKKWKGKRKRIRKAKNMTKLGKVKGKS